MSVWHLHCARALTRTDSNQIIKLMHFRDDVALLAATGENTRHKRRQHQRRCIVHIRPVPLDPINRIVFHRLLKINHNMQMTIDCVIEHQKCRRRRRRRRGKDTI